MNTRGLARRALLAQGSAAIASKRTCRESTGQVTRRALVAPPGR
jgi:hypothetical protein